MTDILLNSIKVENFRSISGAVVVPLNASVVLIHGPNGAGKTSLMSAIALALGGPSIAGVAAPEFLVNHAARAAEIELATSSGAHRLTIHRAHSTIPAGLLSFEDASIFAERCYLEQTALTRLLEVYETVDDGRDSSLTRFVKELLRLDDIESLIAGLHAAGHVTRLRRLVPEFGELEQRIQARTDEVTRLAKQVDDLDAEAARLVDMSAERLGEGQADVNPQGKRDLPAWLEGHALPEALDVASAHRQLIDRLLPRWKALLASGTVASTRDAERAASAASDRHDKWRTSHGEAIDSLLDELRDVFPNLPSTESVTPARAFQEAMSHLDAEIARTSGTLEQFEASDAALAAAEMEVVAALRRLQRIDADAGEGSEASAIGSLALALADVSAHISGDDCPVCGRDFAEVSDRPLSAHLAEEISRITEQAGRLQSLSRARLEATSDLRRSELAVARLNAARVSEGRRQDASSSRARLMAFRQQVLAHSQGAADGAAITRELVEAQTVLARALSRDRDTADLSAETDGFLRDLAAEYDVSPSSEHASSRLAALTESGRLIDATIQAIRHEVARREMAAALHEEIAVRSTEKETSEGELARARAELASLRSRHRAARQQMMRARTLMKDVEAARRAIISGVFNAKLNNVWRDLFVRLVPDEPFVPAFAEPGDDPKISARLETRHRDGSLAGAPQAMLSAGNLNTAALTLFLALHLSAARRTPWLLLDDPVQSMDEVHVAQFAALLRTLTQQLGRRVLIAVHERALFDYLALELTPAAPSSSLVTVEMRRSREGGSSVSTHWRQFEPDASLGAA